MNTSGTYKRIKTAALSRFKMNTSGTYKRLSVTGRIKSPAPVCDNPDATQEIV